MVFRRTADDVGAHALGPRMRAGAGDVRVRYRCPTPCDDDCTAGCHEAHQPKWKRDHDPMACPSALNGAVNR